MSSEEKIVVISLRRIYDGRKAQRAARAIRKLKEIIAKRTHAEVVKIDDSVNKAIWSRGIEKPPRKVRLKITVEEKREVKTRKGETLTLPRVVRVSLASEEKKEKTEAVAK
jgi:large subunit ribosomal protein L31e